MEMTFKLENSRGSEERPNSGYLGQFFLTDLELSLEDLRAAANGLFLGLQKDKDVSEI